ncbi:MAG: hypothetical protein QHH10_13925 [Peptococcaceae bacterium]|jgi:hypothetical protein|nr:hypothetical protein [Peptococcaceae bacterium]MDH7526393.1 hypothetical protein [Peptococcaceae bacterium]
MKDRKKIFVAFCGGCKDEIRRKRVYEMLKEKLTDYEFVFSQEEIKPNDVLLIINGCPTACRTKDFTCHEHLIQVRGEKIGDKDVREEDLPVELVQLIRRKEKENKTSKERNR